MAEHFHVWDKRGAEHVVPADYEILAAQVLTGIKDPAAVPDAMIRLCHDGKCSVGLLTLSDIDL